MKSPYIRLLLVLAILTVSGCAHHLERRGTVQKIDAQTVAFYSKTQNFSASFKDNEVEASYDSKSPGIIEEVVKSALKGATELILIKEVTGN